MTDEFADECGPLPECKECGLALGVCECRCFMKAASKQMDADDEHSILRGSIVMALIHGWTFSYIWDQCLSRLQRGLFVSRERFEAAADEMYGMELGKGGALTEPTKGNGG